MIHEILKGCPCEVCQAVGRVAGGWELVNRIEELGQHAEHAQDVERVYRRWKESLRRKMQVLQDQLGRLLTQEVRNNGQSTP